MSAGQILDVPDGHRRIVISILRAHLPPGSSVWVFGSRAAGRARTYSDLDLAIDAGRPLTLDESAQLREGFSESERPYRVDLVDWQAIGADFRRAIAVARVLLFEAAERQPSSGA